MSSWIYTVPSPCILRPVKARESEIREVKPAAKTTVKTTVELPEDLWRAAKIRAMDERSDLRSVLIAALDAFLKPSRKN